MFFSYGEKETAYLSEREERLGEAIARIGPIEREVDGDLFTSVIHHIISQQISTAAQMMIWRRLSALLSAITPEAVCAIAPETLQTTGISHRKAGCIHAFARQVCSGGFDIDALSRMPDRDVMPGAVRSPRRRRVDGGNGAYIRPAKARCAELWGFGHPPGTVPFVRD